MPGLTDKQRAQAMKMAIAALGTDEFVKWAEKYLPKCCGWVKIYEAGLTGQKLRDLGAYVSVFLIEKAVEEAEHVDQT